MVYSDETLDLIKEKVDIVEYISQYADLEQKGNEYICKCMLHDENTASFTITPDKKVFYCFGCGCGGSVIKFAMLYHGISFDQAVKKLARSYGIDCKRDRTVSPAIQYLKRTKRNQEKYQLPSVQHKILDIEKDYHMVYPQQPAQVWIDEGISAALQKKYDIRYDPRGKRISYPLFLENGDMIGIKGRTTLENYKELRLAKYMNYYKLQTTDFFVGMHMHKDSILAKKEIIIFEGIKSVMKAESWQYDNAVSAETSSLNKYQIRILIRLGVRVVLCFDKGIKYKKILNTAKQFSRYVNVSIVYDWKNLLNDKDSPVDQGKDVWEYLYHNRKAVI